TFPAGAPAVFGTSTPPSAAEAAESDDAPAGSLDATVDVDDEPGEVTAADELLHEDSTREVTEQDALRGAVEDEEAVTVADVPAAADEVDDGEPGDGEAGDDVEGVDAEDLLVEDAAPAVESPYERPGRWYVVHAQSGYEKKVKQNLEARISTMNMEGRIYEVVIPMEGVVEFRGG